MGGAEETNEEVIEESVQANTNYGSTNDEGQKTPTIQYFDDALAYVGGFGFYHVLAIFCMQMSVIQFAGAFLHFFQRIPPHSYTGNTAFMPYATYLPQIECLPYNQTTPLHFKAIDASHKGRAANYEFCELYGAGKCASIVLFSTPCTHPSGQKLHYNATFATIIAEWNLICDKAYVPELINSIQMAGALLSLATAGVLSDQFGRKTIFVLSYILLISCDVASAMMTDWMWFATTRLCL